MTDRPREHTYGPLLYGFSEIAPANERPPLVQEYFNWPPVRDPSEDQQALRDQPGERLRRNPDHHGLGDDDGEREHRDADGKRPTADPKQLVEIEPDDAGAIVEIGRSRGSSLAQLTMNSSASLSRSRSRNGNGSRV
jgi:hypothetical protein